MSQSQYLLKPSFRSTIRRLRQATIGSRITTTHGELYNPFFIVGSGRSGTTLMRRILCTNPDIHIPPELDITEMIRVYDKHCKQRWREFVYISLSNVEYRHKQFQYSLRTTAEKLIALPKKERCFARIIASIAKHDAESKGLEFTRWGDKTPYNVTSMNEILHMFPDARFVHMFRDGCDVVQSFVHYGIYDKYENAAKVWVNAIKSAEQFTHRDRLFTLQYEELVNTPEQRVQEVCAFLDIPFSAEMLNANEKSKQSLTEEIHQKHHENLFTPVSTNNIGKGRAAMPQQQREALAPLMDPWLLKLGYKSCLDAS